MATRFLFISRSMALIAAKPSFSRSYASLSLSASPLLRLRPLVALSAHLRRLFPANPSIRSFATRQTSSSLNDPNPNWSNRPPKETILLDGCDFEHWLVVVEPPKEDTTRDEIIDSYIKTLAQVVGSEEEARMKIYSVSTKHYFAFGALVSEELSYKLKELPGVRWVLPDSYLDVRNKDYGGEPFINGQAVPYDPKYHAEWVRNNARANERNRRNDRPRNNDRSRNFERRRENLQNQNQGYQMNQGGPNSAPNFGSTSQNPSNVGTMPPNNMRPPNMGPNMMMPNMGPNNTMPNNMGPNNAMPNNMGPNNAMRNNMGPSNTMPNNMGPSNTMPNNMGPSNTMPNNMGPSNTMLNNMGPSNTMPNNMGPSNGMPNNTGRLPQNMGYQPNNMGGVPNNAPNYQYRGGPSDGSPQYNMGGVPNKAPNYQYQGGPSDGGPQYQSRDMHGPPQQNREFLQNYDPNAPVGNNNYQPQNVEGRDMPPLQGYQ